MSLLRGGTYPHKGRAQQKGKNVENAANRIISRKFVVASNNRRRNLHTRDNLSIRPLCLHKHKHKQRQDKKPIHPIHQAESDSDSTEDYLYTVHTPKKSPTVLVTVNKHCFYATLDTGASLNVIDRATYEKMDGVKLKTTMLKHLHIMGKRLLNSYEAPCVAKFILSLTYY